MRIPFRTKDPYKQLESILSDFNKKEISELLDIYEKLLCHPQIDPNHPEIFELHNKIESRINSYRKRLAEVREHVVVPYTKSNMDKIELTKKNYPEVVKKFELQQASKAARKKAEQEEARKKAEQEAAARKKAEQEAAAKKKAKEAAAKNEAKLKTDIGNNLICPNCHGGGDWFEEIPYTPKEETTRLESMGLVQRNCKYCNKKSSYSISIE